MRASFSASIDQLMASSDSSDRRSARSFGLLGLLDGPETSRTVASTLLGLSEHESDPILDRLASLHLVETVSAERIWRHDLLRLTARDWNEANSTEVDRAAAIVRALELYIGVAWRMLALVRPGSWRLARARAGPKQAPEFRDASDALEWLDRERLNLVGIVTRGAATPGVPPTLIVEVAFASYAYWCARHYWNDWQRLQRAATVAAEEVGDPATIAWARYDLGVVYGTQGDSERAIELFTECASAFDEASDDLGVASCLVNNSELHKSLGRLEEAVVCAERSVALFHKHGYERGEAACHQTLGELYCKTGDVARGLRYLRQSIAEFDRLGDQQIVACAVGTLALMQRECGRTVPAARNFRRSRALFGELGDQINEAKMLLELGTTHQHAGALSEALKSHQAGLRIAESVGDRQLEARLRDQIRLAVAAGPRS